MAPHRVALVGLGKIARDQHVPAITGSDEFVLAATASQDGPGIAGIPHASSLEALLEKDALIDTVVLCTPPQVRSQLAALALERGLHVFLEKPPGATAREVEALRELARTRGLTLFTSWHSRFAPAVEPARAWLAHRKIRRVSVAWREDVRVWHPGQSWIWEAGGFGVFDPGINALSILTHILPHPVFVLRASLDFPANCAAPIAADVELRDTNGVPISMNLNFLHTGPPVHEILVETEAGALKLSAGGEVLSTPSGTTSFKEREYAALYRHFADLIKSDSSDIDCCPLQLVADVFLCSMRKTVEPFHG